MDFDPDGIGIMSTYKYGSVALSHENQSLIVPSISWLGIQSADIIPVQGQPGTGLLKLSSRDRRVATKMLERAAFQEEIEWKWRSELQVMLMLNCKAEIQILSDDGGDLEGFLDNKLAEAISRRRS